MKSQRAYTSFLDVKYLSLGPRVSPRRSKVDATSKLSTVDVDSTRIGGRPRAECHDSGLMCIVLAHRGVTSEALLRSNAHSSDSSRASPWGSFDRRGDATFDGLELTFGARHRQQVRPGVARLRSEISWARFREPESACRVGSSCPSSGASHHGESTLLRSRSSGAGDDDPSLHVRVGSGVGFAIRDQREGGPH